MPAFRTLALFALIISLSASSASAHYLWVVVDGKAGKQGTANIYFEGGPAPGDGGYLDPFVERGETVIRTVAAPKPAKLKTTVATSPGKRWLSAKLATSAPRSVDSYGKWGVYRYGKTDVLLHYYARYLEVTDHDDLHELARAEKMALDIVPHDETGGSMELTVLWHGKPATGRMVYLRGPKGFRQNMKTDQDGRIEFKIGDKGRYTIRTSVEEVDKSGTFEGKDYQVVRHHATLTFVLPLH